MSRVGKAPIPVPSGVTVTIHENEITCKGSKGELKFDYLSECVSFAQEENIIKVKTTEHLKSPQFQGLYRSLLNNAIEGVEKGFEKQIEVVGVGYKANIKGTEVEFHLGYSHPIHFEIPEGVTVTVDKENANVLTIAGIDKQKVGQVAAHMRELRKPEPYKGKGIRYRGEYIFMKAGKSAAAK